jgi:hypothetical protein
MWLRLLLYRSSQLRAFALMAGLLATLAATPTQASQADTASWIRALTTAPTSSNAAGGGHLIGQFRGSIRVPPTQGTLFEQLTVRTATAYTSPRIGKPAYSIELVPAGMEDLGYTSATIFGAAGHDGFDQAQTDAATAGCDASTSYCVYPDQLFNGSSRDREYFFGSAVAGAPAIAVHTTTTGYGPEQWEFYWYDAATDESYGFYASGSVAESVGGNNALDVGNATSAQVLADLASASVAIRLQPEVRVARVNAIHGSSVDSDTAWILGEVQNTGDVPAYNVTISGRLVDTADATAGAGSQRMDYLGPGQKSGYSISVSKPGAFVRAEAMVASEANSSYTYAELTATGTALRNTTDRYDGAQFRYAGVVTNTTAHALAYTKIYVSFLDAQESVVSADYTYTQPEVLQPGSTYAFEVKSDDERYNPKIAGITHARAYIVGRVQT